MFELRFRLQPNEPFAPVSLMRSAVNWDDLAARCRRGIVELETTLPPLKVSVLVQETDGLAIEKDAVEERVTAGAQFPAEFSGPSFVIVLSNNAIAMEWASNDINELDKGFGVLRERACEFPSGERLPDDEPLDADFVTEVRRPLHLVPLAEKLGLIRADHAWAFEMAPSAMRTVVMYGETLTTELFVSRERRIRQQISRVKRAAYILVANRSGSPVMSRAGRDVVGGFEQASMQSITWGQLKLGLELLPGAEPMPPGEYEVILDGEWAGLLAHEALGHGVEADIIDKNRSRAASYIGHRLGNSLLSMRDSPAELGRSGSYFFDHEGVLAAPTMVLDRGVLVRPLSTKSVTNATGAALSANGRRQSPLHKLYTRMSNTDFLPGQSRLEDLIAAVRYGFYLQMPTGGMEDPKGWGVQCQGAMAREIEHGQFSGRCFGPVCLTGYLPDLLMSVRMVASDFFSDGMGYCGKGHKDFVKVTSGGPAILLRARLS